MRALRGLLLALLVVLPYAGSLQNGFVYDDHEVILGQAPPEDVAALLHVFAEPHFRGLPYYRPVVRATLLGERMLHGDVPAPFHAVNAVLLALAALLADALLRLPAFGVAPGPAWLAAALFALHPLASSAVYPIASGRETLLPAVLALASTYGFLRGGAAWRAASAVAFAGALFGKEASVVLPAAFVMADLLGLPPDPPRRTLGAWTSRYALFAAILVLYLAVRASLFGGSGLHLALLDDPFGPLRSLGFALQTVFVPRGDLAYEPEWSVWLSLPRLLAACAAALLLAIAAWREGPALRAKAAFWLSWLVLSLLPTANLLRQEAPFDERYVFVGWLAFPATAALLASAHWRVAPLRRAVVAAGAGLVALSALASAARGAWYHDDAVFADQWLRTNPASPEAHHLRGLLALEAGEHDLALAELREAARLAPDSPEIHHNLGTALVAAGKPAGARIEFETVLRLVPDHPEAHNNLGLLAASEGRLDEAEAHYRAALRAEPAFVEAMNNLATLLLRRGDLEGAEAELRRATRLAPGYAAAQRNLAAILARTGRLEEAAPHQRAADRSSRSASR